MPSQYKELVDIFNSNNFKQTISQGADQIISQNKRLRNIISRFMQISFPIINEFSAQGEIEIALFNRTEIKSKNEIIIAVNINQKDYQKRSILWDKLRNNLDQIFTNIKNPVRRFRYNKIYNQVWIEVNPLKYV